MQKMFFKNLKKIWHIFILYKHFQTRIILIFLHSLPTLNNNYYISFSNFFIFFISFFSHHQYLSLTTIQLQSTLLFSGFVIFNSEFGKVNCWFTSSKSACVYGIYSLVPRRVHSEARSGFHMVWSWAEKGFTQKESACWGWHNSQLCLKHGQRINFLAITAQHLQIW